MFLYSRLNHAFGKYAACHKHYRLFSLTLLCAVAFLMHPAVRAWALESTTTTTFAVTANGTAVTSVVSGTVVTLSATVKAGATAQSPGQVQFCDATAAHCTDIHLIGVAQLSSSGVAVFRFVPGLGSHTYKAEFSGTSASLPSASAAYALSVTGTYPTTTTIVASGQSGSTTLTATVASTSPTLAPTGAVNFLDETNGGSLLGTANLGQGSSGFNLLAAPAPALIGGAIASGDFNNDGKADLVTIDNAGNVTVALGQGDGTFASLPAAALLSYTYIEAILAADFNSDGNTDLAIVGSANNVTILLGNGDGTFTVGSTPLVGQFPAAVAGGDWNGDGVLDLAVSNNTSNDVTILLGNGDGSFNVGATIPTSDGPGLIVSGDFNGDGKLDLAVLTYTDYAITVFLGNGDGTFTQQQTPALTSFDVGGLAVADFNGDGNLDIALSVSPAGIYTALGNGDGTFMPAIFTATPVYVPGMALFAPGSLVVGDFNGDGKTDIAAADSNGNDTSLGPAILLGNGDGTFTVEGPYPGTYSYSPLTGADFNGDGEMDLAYVGTYTNSGTSPIDVVLAQGGMMATATATTISPIGDTSHQVEGSYGGDTNFGPSVSPEIGIEAEPLATQLKITAAPSSSTYGQQVVLTATLSPSSSSGLSTDGEMVTFLSNYNVLGTGTLAGGVASINVASLPAGMNSLSASYQGDANFDYSSSSAVNFTVAPALLTVVPQNASRSFGQSNPQLNGSVTGALNGDTFGVTGSSTATVTSPVGSYPITYTVYGGDISNYSVVYATGTLTVTAAAPVLAWSTPAAITYGAALSSLQLDATSATAGSFVYSPAAGAVLSAGVQTLSATFTPTDATDYTTNSVNTSLTVNKALLSLTANNETRLFGTANSAFTGSISGATNGDTVTESFSTSANQTSNVGAYAIVPSASGAAIGNYGVVATDGTLTVTQAGSATTLVLSNDNLTLTATVTSLTSGMPTGTVGFYEGQTLVGTGTLLGGMATYTLPSLPMGSVQIDAQYTGDINFTSSSSSPAPLLSLVPASTSLSVTDAGNTTDTLTIATIPGYLGTIQFTCSGLPKNAACSFQPSSVVFTGTSNTGSVALTIDTGTTANLRVPSLRSDRREQVLSAISFFWIPGVSLLFFRKRRGGRALPNLFFLFVLCAVAGGLTSCSSGGSPTTPAGTSTVQVIATGSGGLTLTTSLTLTVQ